MRRRSLVLLACAAAVAGCGNERPEVPGLTDVARPTGAQPVEFERAGVAFVAPTNWFLQDRQEPAVFTMQSGNAFVTGFAYRREEDLPRTDSDLADAERRLRAEVEDRDPGFAFRSSRTRQVDGAPAVELRGTQTIANRRLETRSVHVYKGSVEYVFEALAPADSFELASGGVLRRLLDSVELTGRLRRERRGREG